MTLLDYPNLKQKDRAKIHKQFEKLANPVQKSSKKKISNKELADILTSR